MSKASGSPDKDYPTGSEPDSVTQSGSEADKEIAELRKSLNEHLRSFETPKPPVGSRNQSPQMTSYRDATHDMVVTNQAGSSDTRPWLVALAAFSGLLLGVYFTVSMTRKAAVNRPTPAGQFPLQPSKDRFSPPQPKQKIPSPSAATNTSPQSTEQAGRTKHQSEAEAESSSSAGSTEVIRWQACLANDRRDADPPQPGETWWPVVGSSDSLADARLHCRADAFINKSGNAQISSFRDRETAETFAEQLTQDSTHPWRFRVGEPSVR
jgi:hypothetical protein